MISQEQKLKGGQALYIVGYGAGKDTAFELRYVKSHIPPAPHLVDVKWREGHKGTASRDQVYLTPDELPPSVKRVYPWRGPSVPVTELIK